MKLNKEQRKELAAIRKLIKSTEDSYVKQALDLLVSLDDAVLWKVMTEGLSFKPHPWQRIAGESRLVIGAGEITKRVKSSHRLQVAMVVARQAGLFDGKEQLSFGPTDNIERITDLNAISGLTALKELHLYNSGSLTDITALSTLPNLESLMMESCARLRDLQPLSAATNLRRLFLSGPRFGASFDDIGPLQNIDGLEEISLSSCRSLVDLTPLSHLKNLKSLTLSSCRSIPDLTALKGSPLTELILDNCSDVSLRGLESLTHLEHFTLRRNETIVDLSPLTHLTNLKSLSFSFSTVHQEPVLDLTPLAGLLHLENLQINGVRILDLHPLAELTKMKELSLPGEKGERGSFETLQGLEKMVHLEQLKIASSTLSDITALAGLTKLQFLDLGVSVYRQNTTLTDISALGGLVNLTGLFLEHCKSIADIRPLASLTELTVLRLGCEASGMPASNTYGNHRLQDLRPLQNLTRLTDLSLNNCTAVSDVQPLTRLTQLERLDLNGCAALSDREREKLSAALPTTNISSLSF